MKLSAILMSAAFAASMVSVNALYTASDDVIQVNDEKTFDKTVLKSGGISIVEFYAPWCGHCKNLAPAWKQAAKALKGVVNIVAVDATQVQALGSKYGVQGYPTIKVFGTGSGGQPVDYNGGRDAQAIISFAMTQVQSLVKSRSGGGGGGSSSGSGSGSQQKPKAKSGGGSASEPGGGKSVVTLTQDNFDELVLNSQDAWMVEFYAPWCGHCKTLAPEWAEAAEQMKDDVKFGALDATAHAAIAGRFDVRGYPTIKMFPGGAKNGDSSARDYNGERSASGIAAAAAKLAESSGVAPSVDQLVSQAQFDEACSGKRICLISILPHILDDGARGRKARLAALTEAAGKQRGKPFKFLWSEVGAQSKLEGAVAVGLTPALYAVAAEKKVYTVHKGAFDATAISNFATSLTTPKGASGAQPFAASFNLRASIASATAWDGKDGKVEAETDEFSLDDLKDL